MLARVAAIAIALVVVFAGIAFAAQDRSPDKEFKTKPRPTPTAAPTPVSTPVPTPVPTPAPVTFTFSNITVEEVGEDYAVVSWNIDPPAQGWIVYGLTTDYELGATTQELGLLGFHRQRISGLQPDTTYHFAILARIHDAAGGEPAVAMVAVQ